MLVKSQTRFTCFWPSPKPKRGARDHSGLRVPGRQFSRLLQQPVPGPDRRGERRELRLCAGAGRGRGRNRDNRRHPLQPGEARRALDRALRGASSSRTELDARRGIEADSSGDERFISKVRRHFLRLLRVPEPSPKSRANRCGAAIAYHLQAFQELTSRFSNRGKFPGTQLHKAKCCSCEIESYQALARAPAF